MSNRSFFHGIEGLTEQETKAENVREFLGNGTPYLEVPGLVSVESVRVGTMDIPLKIEQEFPVDATGQRLKSETTPLIQLVNAPDGKQILLRGIQSNNGIWQAGEKVYVAGEWEKPSKGGNKKPAPAAGTQPEGSQTEQTTA